MIAILMATRDEAAPLLEALGAKPVAGAPVETYRFSASDRHPAGLLAVTGMGPARAAEAVRHVATTHPISYLLNAGICGALRAGVAPGRVFRVSSAADGDAILSQAPAAPDTPAEKHLGPITGANHAGGASVCLPGDEQTLVPPCAGDRPFRQQQEVPVQPSQWAELPAARLATVSEPVFGGKRRERLAAAAELVDMEGHAIAREAAARGLPVTLLKGVSDCATDVGRDDLHRNLRAVSESVAARLLEGLARWPRERASLARRLADFVKVEHTIFSLPLLFAGAWLGAGGRMPTPRVLLLVALAGLGARTLGMAMNRILDRHLDRLNPRTAGRDLPSGRLTLVQAWGVAAAGLLVYGLACAALGPLCLRLSPLPAAVLISYSLLKRFTPLCHFGIGLTLALGPLCAWVATTGRLGAEPAVALLAAFTFCWMSGFDIIYALQDLESDRRTGVRSLPAALGARGAEIVAALLHALATAFAAALWRATGGGLAAALPLAAAAVAFAAAHNPRLPLPARFFPVSAVAGIAGSLIPILGGHP